jgi:hypothetical protein
MGGGAITGGVMSGVGSIMEGGGGIIGAIFSYLNAKKDREDLARREQTAIEQAKTLRNDTLNQQGITNRQQNVSLAQGQERIDMDKDAAVYQKALNNQKLSQDELTHLGGLLGRQLDSNIGMRNWLINLRKA